MFTMELNFSLLKKKKKKEISESKNRLYNNNKNKNKKEKNKQTNKQTQQIKYVFGHFHYEPDISLLVSTVPSGLLAKVSF